MWTKIERNSSVEVGDKVVWYTSFGNKSVVTIVRITANFSFSEKMKFPRFYGYGFQSYPKEKWNTSRFEVYREVKEEDEKDV